MGRLRQLLCAALAWTAFAAFAQGVTDRLAAAVREGGKVVVYGATDRDVIQAVIDAFEAEHPGLRVDYHDMNSSDLYRRVVAEAAHGGGVDVVWSSAMDLQVKLVNDGYAQRYRSAETASLPAWAVWKDEAFGTTYEPAALVYSRRGRV